MTRGGEQGLNATRAQLPSGTVLEGRNQPTGSLGLGQLAMRTPHLYQNHRGCNIVRQMSFDEDPT